MAVQAASPLAFITGGEGGGPSNPTLTPEAYERRQQLAMALMKEGGNYSPIQSPWQGVARVTDAISGALQSGWADQDRAAAMKQGADAWADILGGGGSPGGASPAPGSASAAPAGGGGAPGASATSLTGDMSQYANAIGSVESDGSGGYAAVGPPTKSGDRAYGKFQVMGNNIPEWTQAALGTAMTPQQFLASPQAQDAVFNHRFGGYLQKYGNPQDAASAWFTGGPLSSGANKSDVLGTTGNVYVNKFNHALANLSGGAPQVAQAGPVNPPLNPQAVASNDPSFVPPQVQTQQQGAIPLPPIDPPTAGPAVPDQSAQQPPAPMPPPSGPAMAGDGGAPVMQGNPANPQALAAALQAKAAQMQGGAPAAPAPVAPIPQPAPLDQSASNGPVQAPQAPQGTPQPSAGTPGAQSVAAAMQSPTPVPVPPPPPVAALLPPGAQQVAQAIMPQQQAQQQQPDMRKIAAVLANPWVPEAEKAMIMQRFQPHEMMSVQTGQGTMLIDKITGQQRGFIPTANNTVIENQDGTKSIINTNDPTAVSQFNQHGGQQAQLQPGQATPYQLFPGIKTPGENEVSYTKVYNDAVAKGQQPPEYNGWLADHQKAGAQSVTIAGETEESKALGAARAKNIVGYMEQGQDARTKLQALNLMSEALKAGNGNISTGPGAEMILNAKEALGNALGINLDGTAPAEVVKKLGAQLASAAAKSLTARPTQFDFKTFLGNNPSLEISPQGNALMINIMSQQAQHEMELSQMAQSYKGNTADWNDVVSKYDKEHPILSPFTGKPLGADQKLFDDPNKGPTPSPKSEEEYNQLPSGTQFMAPDGVMRIKP